ncbi:MAG: winged helix-turn-helix transcriptional regulator [Candidatus Bathyarchaeota archaeon]|nr:MAG: winged helix-turn-helix transcriptional regulator [Candidatus Bathyarchaeota archaeon]UCE57529.1 MAG: winged helix-turn-helix transcriptional regulator [Candidatus Bathyarchaeota archaeon]
MKKKMLNLLLELLKDSKRSDRELAKVLGVSQPTVSRTRSKLVKEGIIQEFTVIPDFVKMGYEIMAITTFQTRAKDMEERTAKWAEARPNVIFAARANGMGKNGATISVHKSFADYSNFVSDLRLEWGDALGDYDMILISLRDLIAKPLSLKYLAEQKET